MYVFPNICFAENVVPYQTITTNIKVNINIYFCEWCCGVSNVISIKYHCLLHSESDKIKIDHKMEISSMKKSRDSCMSRFLQTYVLILISSCSIIYGDNRVTSNNEHIIATPSGSAKRDDPGGGSKNTSSFFIKCSFEIFTV